MFSVFLKTTFRNLAKRKLNTLINLLGLSVIAFDNIRSALISPTRSLRND